VSNRVASSRSVSDSVYKIRASIKINNVPDTRKTPHRIFLLLCVLLEEPHWEQRLAELEIRCPQQRHKLNNVMIEY
jgi:hypothetical protein